MKCVNLVLRPKTEYRGSTLSLTIFTLQCPKHSQLEREAELLIFGGIKLDEVGCNFQWEPRAPQTLQGKNPVFCGFILKPSVGRYKC